MKRRILPIILAFLFIINLSALAALAYNRWIRPVASSGVSRRHTLQSTRTTARPSPSDGEVPASPSACASACDIGVHYHRGRVASAMRPLFLGPSKVHFRRSPETSL